jgi:hypothetical protein
VIREMGCGRREARCGQQVHEHKCRDGEMAKTHMRMRKIKGKKRKKETRCHDVIMSSSTSEEDLKNTFRYPY